MKTLRDRRNKRMDWELHKTYFRIHDAKMKETKKIMESTSRIYRIDVDRRKTR